MIWAIGLSLCAEAGTLVEFRQGSAQAYDAVVLSWPALEPAAGEWDFSGPDAAIADAKQPVVGTLFPGQFRGAAPPDAKDSFRPVLGARGQAYVRRVVQRYADRVQVWRIGEDWSSDGPDPASSTRLGPGGFPPEALAQFIAAVTTEVRNHDADARIVGPRLPGSTQSAVSGQLADRGPDHWAETGDAGALVRSRVSAWVVDQGPIFWVIPDDESGRTVRTTVGLLQTHLSDAVTIERMPNLAYEQYGYRFTRADGATRWVYWGQGEVMLSDPWPKAFTSVVPGDDGRHAWRGVGDTVVLGSVPVLLRN